MEGIPPQDLENHIRKIRDQAGPKAKKQKKKQESDDDDEDDDDDDESAANLFSNQMQFPNMAGMPPMNLQAMMQNAHMPMMNLQQMGHMPGMPPMGSMPGMSQMTAPPWLQRLQMGPNNMPAMGPGIRMGPNGMPLPPHNMAVGNMRQGGAMMPQSHMMPAGMDPRTKKEENPERAGGAASNIPQPLFPAASNIQQNSSCAAASSGDGNQVPLKTSQNAQKTYQAHSQLMHPGDEEQSLEEIRSKMSKFQPGSAMHQSRGVIRLGGYHSQPPTRY